MTNELTVFHEQEMLGKVFKIYGNKDNPLFLAKDVAEWIEHSKTSMMLQSIDEDEKLKETIFTSGQKREVYFLTEDGLYEVLMQSRKPIAKEFKKKVKATLKTIRKTGAYMEVGREEEIISKYFPSFSEEVKLAMVQDLMKSNEKLQVKATKFDQFLDTDSTYTFTDVAKMISTKASEEYGNTYKVTNKSLPKYLREKGILSKAKSGGSYTNLPNQKFEQYFDVVSRKTQGEFEKTQTRVKACGVEFIYDELVLDGFQSN